MLTILPEAIKRLVKINALRWSASLSFTSLLALVPVLTLMFGMLARIDALAPALAKLRSAMLANLVPDSALALERHLLHFTREAQSLQGISLLIIAITALAAIRQCEHAFNAIWQKSRHRPLHEALPRYLLLVIVMPATVAIAITLSNWLLYKSMLASYLPNMQHIAYMSEARALLMQTLSPLLLTASLALSYRLLPHNKISWGQALAGAIPAALLLELARHGFAAFVLHSPNFSAVYGAFAALPLFLIWLQISWLITLFGAALVWSCQRRK